MGYNKEIWVIKFITFEKHLLNIITQVLLHVYM